MYCVILQLTNDMDKYAKKTVLQTDKLQNEIINELMPSLKNKVNKKVNKCISHTEFLSIYKNFIYFIYKFFFVFLVLFIQRTSVEVSFLDNFSIHRIFNLLVRQHYEQIGWKL